MTGFDWAPLREALAACRSNKISVPMWWRDDDAITMTTDLEKLISVAEGTGVSVHLAIIPAKVDPDLPRAVEGAPICPVIHGWAHADHSTLDVKKNEFLTPRADATGETQSALDKMIALFGPMLCRMFVPPWNRISADVTSALVAQGYKALSTYGARDAARVAGLVVVNTHVDPIWWKGTRDLVEPEALIASAASHLLARANRDEDAGEPFGLLTHHLVHTPAIWSFAETFLTEMQTGGATLWTMENDE